MSNYSNTKATIAANVYTNHANQVTAEMVKTAINAVVDTIIAGGFLYKGVAIPSTNPGSPDANVAYIAATAGTYTNFGGLVVADGEVAVLKYNGSWTKEVTGAATATEVSALGHEVSENTDNILNLQQEINDIQPIVINGNVTNAPDEEDITTDENNLLKFADRSTAVNQKGYKILRKNKTLAEQVTNANTIYEVRYEFDINNATVTIPAGCELRFAGGKIVNGTIVATNRLRVNEWGFEDVTINGYVDTTSPLNVPVDNAKEFCETILAYKETTSVEPTVFVFATGKRYDWGGVLNINKKNVSLIGGGTIEGTIHLGLTAAEFTELNYGAYPATSHFNYVISGLRFSKYRVIGNSTDSAVITNYIKNATADNDNNIAISLVNVCHVKISDCFFDNVPFPIVYKPNDTYVNQNVRRLNVTNCDFERCHTGIYAPSIVQSSIEYGDLLVANCNFFPTHAGIDCDCIDGFKLFGNIFNTGSIGVHPYNVKAVRAGQVVISHNSFYGENNDFAVMLDTSGNAEIVGNLFSSQSTSEGVYPYSLDSSAALIIKATRPGYYCEAVTVTGNQFIKVEKATMILLDGDIRSVSIEGNSMTNNTYLSKRRFLWRSGPSLTIPRAMALQLPMVSGVVEEQFDSLNFHLRVIRDLALKTNYTAYPGTAAEHLGGEVYKYATKRATIASITKYKPIFVCRFRRSVAPSTAETIHFIFNGIAYHVEISFSMTYEQVFNAIISALTSDWSDTYSFSIIANCLWIVGKSNNLGPVSPLYVLDQNTQQVLETVYTNMGFRITVKDVDGKGFIEPRPSLLASGYYGIDGDDDGKRLIFKGKNLTLHATNVAGKHGKIDFRTYTTPTPDICLYLLDNDTFFGVEREATETSAEVVSAIVNLAYSDIFTVDGNNLVLNNKGEEFYYVSAMNFAWYWTWNGHVADYQFLTDDGRIYNPSTDSYNDEGTTAQRPSASSVRVGFIYFDETLGKCIVSNGTSWLNMDGSALT